MDLVDDIHPHFHLGGRVDGIVPQVPDVVHAVIGGGVNFQHVHAGTGIDGPAGGTAVAGISAYRVQAVDGFGQNFGAAGLARAPGPGEEIGVAHFSRHNLGLEGLGHSQLARYIIKGLGTVFSIKRLIG